MTGSLIILSVTVIAGILLCLHHKYTPSEGEHADDHASAMPDENDNGELCCGRHAVCEKELSRPEDLYYNDEELDRFAGHDPDSYTDDEIEEFREILYTLRHDEVYGWGAALTQRNIPLPHPLRDEWMMLCE